MSAGGSAATAGPAEQRAPAKKSSLAASISGALAGVAAGAFLQPLDVVRTYMQYQSAQGVQLSSAAATRAVVAEGGLRALWRGTQPTVIRLGLGAGLYFAILQSLHRTLDRRGAGEGEKVSSGMAVAIGGAARLLSGTVLVPVTLVKTRMESVGYTYTGTLDALRKIVRESGARGLFKGAVPTLAANVPFSAIYYLLYQRAKDGMRGVPWLAARGEAGRDSMALNALSSVVASIGATVITQPVDVLRTRVQLDLVGQAGRGSLLEGLQRMVAAGMPALMSGVGPRFLKRTAQTVIIWTVYEELTPVFTTRLRKAKEAMDARKRGSTA
ncbi:unnamed protein product [Pedinophyceae sp. YPF-701]|nr:unnamed protein product [Pedinophyceae sp. YPF-701]